MKDIQSNFVRHEPCPNCNSRDNLARYSDGHAYCFGCEYREPAVGEVNEFNNNNCLLYTSPSPRDGLLSRMPSSA